MQEEAEWAHKKIFNLKRWNLALNKGLKHDFSPAQQWIMETEKVAETKKRKINKSKILNYLEKVSCKSNCSIASFDSLLETIAVESAMPLLSVSNFFPFKQMNDISLFILAIEYISHYCFCSKIKSHK